LGKIANALGVHIYELFWEGRAIPKEHDLTHIVVKEMLIAQKVAAESVVNKYLNPSIQI